MNCRDIMIDTETLGKKVNAPIIQVGAVAFDRDTGELGPQFFCNVTFESALKHGVPDGDTVAWWMQQSEAARMSLFSSVPYAPSRLGDVLVRLERLYSIVADEKQTMNPPDDPVRVWGNGATFDIAKLEYQYEVSMGRDKSPWPFYAPRDTRTVEDLSNLIRQEALLISGWQDDGETHHNALSDAKYQVAWLVPMLNSLKVNS